MKGIDIELTPLQVALLRPLFEEIAQLELSGEHGAVMAQIHEASEGGFMVAKLIDHDLCEKIQTVTGVEPGKLTKLGATRVVWVAE